MSVSTEFKEIVAKGDKNAVRTSLANYMILDRSYSLFDEAYSYAASQMDNVFEYRGLFLPAEYLDRAKNVRCDG